MLGPNAHIRGIVRDSIFVTLCAKGDRRYRDVTKFFKNFQPHYNDLSPVNCKYV